MLATKAVDWENAIFGTNTTVQPVILTPIIVGILVALAIWGIGSVAENELEDRLQEEAAKAEGMVTTPDDMPRARLTLQRDGADSDDFYEVRGDAVIGRFDETVGPVDIDLGPLPEGSFISRKHAEIRNADGKWLLKDLGSSNGTFVMGDSDFVRIEEETEIHDGQQISFGNARFVFELVPPAMEAPVEEPEPVVN
jgi:pSer/pThr/pTyr-binding forkhead associated (FHA) protein